MCSGLSDRPRVGCLLWWPAGPWEWLPMGPAEPDVDENKNKILRQGNGSVTKLPGGTPQQDNLPPEQEQL